MLRSSPSTKIMRLEYESGSLTQFLYYRKMLNMQKKGKMSLKMRRPSISLRHMAGIRSTRPRQRVCQGRRHSSRFDIFMFHSSTQHLSSFPPCLHLLLGFLCRWRLSHGPSGTLGNGSMGQVQVRRRSCENSQPPVVG